MKKTDFVIRCRKCRRIKRWIFWIKLSEKQAAKIYAAIAMDKMSIYWTNCPACKKLEMDFPTGSLIS